jgi:hypothetical protein
MLRWLEGFENDIDSTDFARKYGTVTGSSWPTGTGPKSPTELAIGSTNTNRLKTKALVGSPTNTWFLGFRFQGAGDAAATGSLGAGVMAFRGSGADQCEVRLIGVETFNAHWEVRRGSTSLGTSPVFFRDSKDYWEIKIVARTSTNGSVEIRRNGVVFYTLTGVNTANSGSDGADLFEWTFVAGVVGGTHHWDDIYVADDTGGINDDYLSGDLVIHGSNPTSDGASTQWTPSTGSTHFSLVDDAAGSANDADYVTDSVLGNIDLYGYADFTLIGTNTPILGVQVNTVGAMQASGSKDVEVRVRDTGGSQASGTAHTFTSTTIEHFASLFDQNPVTSVDWTKASLNAAQFGLRVAS